VGVPPLTGTLGAGWTYRSTEYLGEFDLEVLLRTNGSYSSKSAAEGWGGAQFDLYQNGANSLVLLGTRWDSEDEAAQFETATRQSFVRHRRDNGLWTDGTRYWALKRVRDKVFLAAGTDRGAVERASSVVK
jgi:hypothetical protein